MISNRKEILFPQFFICCEKLDEARENKIAPPHSPYFWKPIFENLAYGIPPFNSILDGNVLINKTKKEKFIIGDDTSFIRYIEIIQNMFSDEEPKIDWKKQSKLGEAKRKKYFKEINKEINHDYI